MERARPLIRFLLHTNLRVLLEFWIGRSESDAANDGFSCFGNCYLAHIAYLRHNVYTLIRTLQSRRFSKTILVEETFHV